MALDTDFNVSPYFDDYDEEKNFHRILFKPAVAVQARELTQLQTILQNQVERFGRYVFKDGSVVQGCLYNTRRIHNIKLQDKVANGSTAVVSNFSTSNTYVRGLTSNVFAQVVKIADGAEVVAPNYKTLFIDYIQTGVNGEKEFSDNEVLTVVNAETYADTLGTDGGLIQANTLVTNAQGNSLIFSVTDGLIFQKGNFIKVNQQSKIIGKYTLFANTEVGFDVNETLISSFIDDTLNDNALGSTNFQAPGADRLKLTATLTQRGLDETGNSQPFFPIARFENGQVAVHRPRGQLDALGEALATRTWEESGDYTTDPFKIRVQEHLNTNNNFGFFDSDGSNRGIVGDNNKLVALIEGGGAAYIKGQRTEFITGRTVEIDKATDVVLKNAQAVNMNYGGYINVNQVCGKWSYINQNGVSIDLYDTAQTSVGSGTFGKTSVSGSKIGEAKFINLQFVTGSEEDGTGNAQYRLYVYDVEMNAGKSFADVRSFYISNSMGTGQHSFADAITTSGACKLEESNKQSLVFRFGASSIKTLRNLAASANNDNQFIFKTQTDFTISAGCTAPVVTQASGFDTGNQPEQLLNSTDDYVITIREDTETDNLMGVTYTTGSNTITRNSGNTISNIQVGDYVKCSNTSGGNNGVFKVHAVGGSTLTLTGRPSAAGDNGLATIRKYYRSGTILDISKNGSDGGARSVTPSGTQLTVDLGEDFIEDTGATISYNVQKTSAEEKDKVVRRDRYVGINLNTADGGVVGPWTLGITDVFKIKAIYKSTGFGVTGTDVTKEFDLITNQFDTHYENSKIKKKRSSTLALTTADRLTVKLDYFSHDRTAGVGYFSVDSYPVDDTVTSSTANTINTAEIPVYKSPSTGVEYDLRDSVDFRPKYRNQTDGVILSGIGSIVTINTPNTAVDHSTIGTYLPAVETNFQADLQFYLPRIDKVILTKSGRMYVAKGESSLTPSAPNDQADSLTLAQLFIPPYPSLSPGAATFYQRDDYQVDLELKSYKRYTMKDIGSLEDRVSKLEYYSSLNLLEQATRDIKELDGSGVERFKNGFFAEPFVGHNYGDVRDSDYNIAIDSKEGEARPRYKDNIIGLEYDSSGSSNVVDRPKIATITATGLDFYNYVKSKFGISKTKEGVIAVYQGTSWSSFTARGIIVGHSDKSTSPYEYYVEAVEGTFGTGVIKTWSGVAGLRPAITDSVVSATITSVSLPRAGELLTLPYVNTQYIIQPYATKLRDPSNGLGFEWKGDMELFPAIDNWKDTNANPVLTTTELDLYDNFSAISEMWGTEWGDWIETNSTTETIKVNEYGKKYEAGGKYKQDRTTTLQDVSNLQRKGTTLAVKQSRGQITTGNYVDDVSNIPYIRSRVVKFHASGLKPLTRYYPYFDNVKVGGYCYPTDTNYNKKKTTAGIYDHTSAGTGDFLVGGALYSDSKGDVYGLFVIPNNDSIKFTTGQKEFKLTDITDLVTEASLRSSSASAIYTARGLQVTKGNTTITTRTPEFYVDNPIENSTVRGELYTATDTKVLGDVPPPPAPLPSISSSEFNFDLAFGGLGSLGGLGGGGGGMGMGGGGGGGGTIICTALWKRGLLPDDVYKADALYGEMIAATDPQLLEGYYKWAGVVIDWMDGNGPDIMTWIKDDTQRSKQQSHWATKWAQKIATPWAVEMAHQVGMRNKGSLTGKLLMMVGYPITKLVSKVNRKATKVDYWMLIATLAVLRVLVSFSSVNKKTQEVIKTQGI
jgi:hypothetical protein